MTSRYTAIVIGLSCALAIGSTPAPAAGQAEIPDRATAQIAPLVASQMRRIRSIDELRQSMFRVFLSGDLASGGLDPADEVLRRQLAAAEYRAKRVNSVLQHDLDIDGAVSRAELRRSLLPRARQPMRSSTGPVAPTPEQVEESDRARFARLQYPPVAPTPEQVEERLQELVQRLNLPDRDGDGRATIAEIMSAAAEEYEATESRPRRRGPELVYDLNRDHRVALEEFLAVFEAVVPIADPDGDGMLSDDEVIAFRAFATDAPKHLRERAREKARRDEVRARAAACPVPDIPADAEIVLLAMLGSPYQAMVSLGAAKNSTYLIDVQIEGGERPIQLFVAPGAPMILRFSGAVGRLTGAFNIGEPNVGYVGIEPRIAGWFEREDCAILGGKITRAGGHEPEVLDYVEALTGRKPDRIIGKSSVSMIRVPSGELVDITPDAGANENRDESSGSAWKPSHRCRMVAQSERWSSV